MRVGALASFQFELEYQKGTDNGAVDAFSWVPISHSWETIQSLLEGAIVGVTDRGEAKARWIAAHTSSLMLFKVISVSIRKADSNWS